MDDFTRYERLRAIGQAPGQVYARAKADGLDEITSIRLLRRVFGLSLPDAKRAIGAGDWYEAKQAVEVGSKVYWEEVHPVEGPALLEARVTAIEGAVASVDELRRFRPVAGDLIEVGLDAPGPRELPVADLERSLADRLKAWEGHMKGLIEVAG